MKNSKNGEIATLIAIGIVVILGISTLVSSVANLKNRQQTTHASAAENCDSDAWYCAGECASAPVRDIFNGTYPPDGSSHWRNEKAGNCHIDPSQCATTVTCTVPSPTPNCPAGKLNVAGACDQACCSSDSECSTNQPQPQKCTNPNGYCQSGTSCAAVQGGQNNPQFIRKCSNSTCAWVGCSQDEINKGWCTENTNNPPAASIKCNSNVECGATPTTIPYHSPTATPKVPKPSPTTIIGCMGPCLNDTQCVSSACGNKCIGGACTYVAPTVIPTLPGGPNPTNPLGAPTLAPGVQGYSCEYEISGSVSGCVKGSSIACLNDNPIDPNAPNMKGSMCLAQSDCTVDNCLRLARQQADQLAASQGDVITDFSKVQCKVTPKAACGTISGPGSSGVGAATVTGKCADNGQLVDCPAVYPQKDQNGNDMVVNRSCAPPNQGDQKCNYTCFDPSGTNVVDCWPGQRGVGGILPGVDASSFNVYIINKSAQPLQISAIYFGKSGWLSNPLDPNSYDWSDHNNQTFSLAQNQSQKIINNSRCQTGYWGSRAVQVVYTDQTDGSTRYSPVFTGNCSLEMVIGLP